MSRVNSVRMMEENTSESGSDGVEMFADPVRGQENDNEEEAKVNEDGEDEVNRIKQHYNMYGN